MVKYYTGARGGRYYIKNGRRVYVKSGKSPSKRRRSTSKRRKSRSARRKSTPKRRKSTSRRRCARKSAKKYRTRKGPGYPANDCPWMLRLGNDGYEYESRPNKNGVFRWHKL